ncbi:MAG: crossover junction endodeoxyribonuclease RuvC [Treponema sp.]|jgi:crossover junction endodeoxyribonuclease RuvC|nr:crossover junction endodeoxyribonuclease RuvC [Treponema sp.]
MTLSNEEGSLRHSKGPASRRIIGSRIIGIDPGLASTGWGIVDTLSNKIKYVAHGCIETKAGCPRAERLFLIYTQIREVIREYSPQEAAIETLYFAKNVTSAIPVAEARGVLSVAMAKSGILVREFTPLAIKQAIVGAGRAEKEQVQEMVRLILGLTEIPKPDHAADALGAAICAANTVMI